MKRKKIISIKKNQSTVKITVEVDTSDLVSSEVNNLIENLASSSMHAIEGAPFLKVHLSEIKVN